MRGNQHTRRNPAYIVRRQIERQTKKDHQCNKSYAAADHQILHILVMGMGQLWAKNRWR